MNIHPASPNAWTRWLAIAGLLLLTVIPLIGGAVRLNQLATGAEITAANARFFAAPVPVVIHILGSAVYALIGLFQFLTGDRRRWLGFHRVAGWVSWSAGLAVGLSGLWMTLFYPHAVDLLFAFRLAASVGMVASLGLSISTIRQRDVRGHRAWMTRAYALAMGAGTQALTGLVEAIVVAQPDPFSKALSMGAGWLINLAVAEWAIRRRQHRFAGATALAAAQPGGSR